MRMNKMMRVIVNKMMRMMIKDDENDSKSNNGN